MDGRKTAQRARGPGRPAGAREGEGQAMLLRAAREVLAERGLPGTTLRAVAARAGVQPALASYYFGSKDGLLRAVVSLVADEARARMEAALARKGSVEDRLRGLIDSWVEAIEAEPYLPRLIVEQVMFGEAEVIDQYVEQSAAPTVRSIRALLAEGSRAGVLREVEPMFLIPAMIGMCAFFFLSLPILQRVFNLRRVTAAHLRRFQEQAADLMLYGIAVREGGR